jgi:thioredoxin 2
MNCHSFAVYRIESERTADTPACESYSETLLRREPVILREANFDNFVVGNRLPVVVHFWARWCCVSKSMAPHFAAGARRFAEQALFAEVEVDDESGLAQHCEIRSIPTVILFRNGQESIRHSGAMSVYQLELWLRRHLDGETGPVREDATSRLSAYPGTRPSRA